MKRGGCKGSDQSAPHWRDAGMMVVSLLLAHEQDGVTDGEE
jgi:hypothetical protein